MALRRHVIATIVCLPAAAQSILSIHPFTGQRGTTFTATVRGSGLTGASSVVLGDAPFSVTIGQVAPEPKELAGGRNKNPIDLVTLRVTVPETAKPGRYPIRLISKSGVSNALPLHIIDTPVAEEPPGSHDTQDQAVAVKAMPTVFSGRLAQRGEADFYSFHAEAGQTFTFSVNSGLPQIASAGSAATVPNFDPSLAVYEKGDSWFDANRLKRVAYNDEPMWVFGRVTDAHLVHRFEKAGDYLLRVEAFAGQGGPDYSYALKVAQGALPQDLPKASGGWDERSYTRKLDAERMSQLAARGGKNGKQPAIENYRAELKLPGMIEGTLATPGETHRTKFRIDSPTDIAIEIETPAAAPPYFNPIVRLLDASGEEAATNIFAGKGACTGALSKSIQAKTIVPLRNTGEYTIEVRDAATDLNSPDFRYRILVRQQVAHLGRVRIDADAVNLKPGEAKTIRVMFDREEDYRGAVAIAPESLPPGISASVGADYEPDTDPPMNPGKRERYVPRTERAVVVISASADAQPMTEPQTIRLIVRPLADGKLGEKLLTKSLPVMVIAKQ
jgi:hypothetical protein